MTKNAISKLQREFDAVMRRYRSGEFGTQYLHLNEVLKMAGQSDLLAGLTESEVRNLIKHSTDGRYIKE